jgi:uncharacterized protein DUF6265
MKIQWCGLAAVALVGALASAATMRLADDVASLAWMAGSWGDGKVEEHWMAPKGGAMLGMSRVVAGDRMVEFEFLRIEKTKEGLVYFASPSGQPPTPFRAIEQKEKRIVFENPEHDFPQRILYWMDGDSLHARIEGKENGKDAGMEWAWKRLPPAK